MNTTRLLATLRGLLRRHRIDEEIAEELHDHLEREIAHHRARGLPPSEARRLALCDLGGLAHTLEATRDVRAIWLDAVWRDLKRALRMLRRAPLFTITALILLVLAIGSTTAIYAIAHAVLLAAIGLYGVLAQGVAERRQEIGVRMALGATRGQILGVFLRYGLLVVAVGVGSGLVAALAAGRSLAGLVFGVNVRDR